MDTCLFIRIKKPITIISIVFPKSMSKSLLKQMIDRPDAERTPFQERIRLTSRNFFLHIHAPKINMRSLRPTYTFGLGLLAVFTFCTLLITGLILLIHYTPSIERAYTSVQDIIYIVPAGKLVRNMHRWSGHLMIIIVFLHMARTFYTAAYYRTHTLNWITGLCLLLLVITAGFSGYLLPWDQLAYWAVTIASNIAASARELSDALGITHLFDVGYWIKILFFGDESIGQSTLRRFFFLHVVFIPISLIILMGYHFWRIRMSGGLAHPPQIPADNLRNLNTEQGIIPAWPSVMWIELAVFVSLILLLLIFSIIVDAPLRDIANPDFPENPAKSPWYFLGVQEMVSYSAFSGGIILPLVVLTFLFLIPFMDHETKYQGIWFSGELGKKVFFQTGVFILGITICILGSSYFFPWYRQIPLLVGIIINPVTIIALAIYFWGKYIRIKTGSFRMKILALFTGIFLEYMIFMSIGIWFRGPDWQLIW